MKKQLCLWLLLVLSLFLPSRTTTAQYPKQSHHDVPGFDPADGEMLMAQRLHELQQLHQLQDQVQQLLENPEILKRLQQRYSSDFQRLKDQMGKSLQGRDIQELRQQFDTLQNLYKSAELKSPSAGERGSLQGRGPDALPPLPNISGSTIPPMSLPTRAEPEQTFFDRMQKESTKWLMDNLDDVGGNVLDAFAQMDEHSLAGSGAEGFLTELMHTMRHADFADMNLSDNSLFPTLRVGTLANSLSNMGDFLHPRGVVWDEMRSRFHNAPAISLPRFGESVAHASASPTLDGDGGAPAFLSVLMLGAIVVLLCKRIFGFKVSAFDENAGWRLGPWPVPPSRVSTRQDLIRVFEHLALLCFGPSAAVCHHRALAERLAELPPCPPGTGGLGGARRRQAAEMLAWLYEQARYAPAEDALSSEQLSDARHALCLLAGVTAQ